MSYQDVLQSCSEILQKNGRPRESLTVLAVSKLQPVEKIEELYRLGHRAFGENYVQEALGKKRQLGGLEIQWHLIGSLQKNKVKHVLGHFHLIHSVDSLKLAEAISKQGADQSIPQNILLQVNVADEASKGGFAVEEILSAWEPLRALPNLRICGLMTMPPLHDDPEEARPHFRSLRDLLSKLRGRCGEGSPHPLSQLSMGTSHDYHVAIEEGATIVRLGTILFGERTNHRTKP
jgi:hypothetical protein